MSDTSSNKFNSNQGDTNLDISDWATDAVLQMHCYDELPKSIRYLIANGTVDVCCKDVLVNWQDYQARLVERFGDSNQTRNQAHTSYRDHIRKGLQLSARKQIPPKLWGISMLIFESNVDSNMRGNMRK